MKALWLICVPYLVFADFHVCDEKIVANPKYKSALEWLRPFNGRFELGSCKVEIHSCDPSAPKKDRGDLVGDILIVDQAGGQNYVPIHFLLNKSDKFESVIHLNEKMFHYYAMDTVNDPLSGSREEYRLELLRRRDTKALTEVTMGTYNTKRDLPHMDKYTYVWSECFR